MGLAFFKMFLEIHIQNKGHIWKNKGCFWVTWTKISLKNYSMMPIVGLFLAILGFSNVNLRFLAHFHELQRKTSLRMTHKNIKSSLRTISFLEPLKSSYFFGQFKPWRSYKLCSYKKKECRLSLCNMFNHFPILWHIPYEIKCHKVWQYMGIEKNEAKNAKNWNVNFSFVFLSKFLYKQALHCAAST